MRLSSPDSLAALGAACLLVVAGPVAARGDAQTDPWPMPGGDPAHLGVAEGPAPPYRSAWETDLDGAPVTGPIVGEEILVVVTRDAVTALDPDTGDEVWAVERERGSGGPVALASDLVLYTQGRGEEAELVAAGRGDGSAVWRAPIEANAFGGMTIAEGRVYLGTRQGEVVAFDLEDGTRAWTFEGDGRVESAPAVVGDRVFVTSQDFSDRTGRVHALDAETGEEAWGFTPGGNVVGFSSAVVSEGIVYVGTGDLRARAFAAEDGEERWDTRLRAPFGGLTIPRAPDDLVFGDVLGHVYRLDAETGEERWVFRVPGLLTRGAIGVSGGALLVGDDSGQFSAIDLETGLLQWKRDFGDERVGEPAVAADRVYLAPRAGPVVALEHDPGGLVLEEASPTTLFLGEALLNYAAAFAIVLVLLLGVIRVGWGRLGRREEG